MPTRSELIATGRSREEICRTIGADALVYQDLEALKASVRELNPALINFDASCFNGEYVTGDVTPEYLDTLEQVRDEKLAGKGAGGRNGKTLLDINSDPAPE